MDVELCNAALINLGLDPMADPAKPHGRVEKAIVQMHLDVRAEVLEGNAWSACDSVARIEPEENGLVPPGFSHVGLLPADYVGLWSSDASKLAIIKVGEGESARRRVAWCGAASVTIRYSANVPYAIMNPLLKKTCASKLAARVAHIQSDKPSDRKANEDLATQDEIKAAARDALNRHGAPLFHSRWDPLNAQASSDVFGERGGGW